MLTPVEQEIEDLFFTHACDMCDRVPEEVVPDSLRDSIFEEDITESICKKCDECFDCCIC